MRSPEESTVAKLARSRYLRGSHISHFFVAPTVCPVIYMSTDSRVVNEVMTVDSEHYSIHFKVISPILEYLKVE